MDKGLEALLQKLPEEAKGFPATEWPFPISWAINAGPPELDKLKAKAQELAGEDIKKSLNTAACLAELVEAARPQRDEYFLSDARVRAISFGGVKWKAGWVCLCGDKDMGELAAGFKERGFMVFSTARTEDVDTFLGEGETSLAYFLQLMVRYGFIYGKIKPGDDHNLGHFLEKDMPGVLVLSGKLTPIENLLALCLMYLGAPAVVGPEFPYDYGRREVADKPEEIYERAQSFQNLRVCLTPEGLISLPEFCDPNNRQEEVAVATRWGGSENSWFCVRTGEGDEGVSVSGEAGPEMGILVEVGKTEAPEMVTACLEERAASMPGMIKGVSADLQGKHEIGLSAEAVVTPQQVGEAIKEGLRNSYPLLKVLKVKLIFEADKVAALRPGIDKYQAERLEVIRKLTDDEVDEVYFCTDCQPFAHGHTCMLAPSRASMCNSWTFLGAMASAYYRGSYTPWKRRDVAERWNQGAIELGACLNEAKGEYAGVNAAVKEQSGGLVERVFLHDLRDYPHTSCGCFWAIAFYIPEVDGVGIMTRNYEGVAPDGSTWNSLANRAGGKQAPGMSGIGREYIHSPSFLKGHGGIKSVVWATESAAQEIRTVAPGSVLAVEHEAKNIEELKKLIGK